jgi:hypothetical protein
LKELSVKERQRKHRKLLSAANKERTVVIKEKNSSTKAAISC